MSGGNDVVDHQYCDRNRTCYRLPVPCQSTEILQEVRRFRKEYSKTYAKVVRDGKLVNILTSEIVKGDNDPIQAGDKVPADGLLFEGKIKDLQALNGESQMRTKQQ